MSARNVKGKARKRLVIGLFFLLIPLNLFAEIGVDVQLSDTILFLGEELTLQLKVNGTRDNVKLLLPRVDGLQFRQLGRPSSSSQTVIRNGKVSSFSGLVYSVGVSATKKGVFAVPGVEVDYQGNVYRSQPFEIQVKESGELTKMKLVLSSSKQRIYTNEPVTISLEWFVQDTIEDYEFSFPLLDEKDDLKLRLLDSGKNGDIVNLSVSGYKIPFQKTSKTLDGEDYTAYQVEFVIHPSDPGRFRVASAGVTAMIKVGTTLKRDFFGRVVRAPKLKRAFAGSDALILEILSVPEENLPKTYTGGVGDFEISTSADNTQVKVGDPIELTVKVSGKGRFEKINQPLLSQVREFRDNFVIVDTLQPGDIKENAIVFKQIIRPKHDSVSRIPEVEFSFFNPVTERFQTINSNSIPLQVLSANRVKKEEIVAFSETPATTVESFTRKKSGLYSNYVFEDALVSKSGRSYWFLALIFPPLSYFLVLQMVNRQRRLKQNTSLVRAKAAKATGHKQLKLARQLMSEPGDRFYGALSAALSGYVGDKLNLGAGQVTSGDIKKLVVENVLAEENAGKLISLLDEIDRCRFAPQQQSEAEKERLYGEVSGLMKRLEKKI